MIDNAGLNYFVTTNHSNILHTNIIMQICG